MRRVAFCQTMRPLLTTLFEDNNWIAKLAYLADIFTKLNELNLSLQGRDTTILKLYDRVGGFLKKAELWKRLCAESDFSCFPQFDSFVVSENMERHSKYLSGWTLS